MIKIAIINPPNGDGLARTILDGFLSLKKIDNNICFKYANSFTYFIKDLNGNICRDQSDFIDFSKEADLILLIWGKNCTDFELANKIDSWGKTIFIDGSEMGKNRRYDFNIQNKIIKNEYCENGKIDILMLDKCALYFRREKPYNGAIIPFPFGIQSTYTNNYSLDVKKDIDFFCVFGQDEYPLMRRYSKEILIDFCKKNGFSCFTEVTSQENFYKKLARSKVGISVGGGGYDSMRFWETLGNNCILLTEKIDIYEPDSKRLDYKRVWEFGNLYDFEYQLEKLGKFIRSEYHQENMNDEYKKILSEHSSRARVIEILEKAREKGLAK